MSAMLTLIQALKLQDSALVKAHESNSLIAVALVDAGGHLLSFARMDGVGIAAVSIVIGKARTAAEFKMPTSVLAMVALQKPAILATGAIALDGGVPIMSGGNIIGALAIGGLSPEEDHALAQLVAEGSDG
jgi:glc operon protein GlcG